jgi:molybdopterin molybdotransferase
VKPFFDLISADEAYARIGGFPALTTESVSTRTSLGRVIAAEVHAADDIPHFARSNMDGFAVRAADTRTASEAASVRLEITGQVAMGKPAECQVEPGCAVRVSTGAMMPVDADAVVIVEKTEDTGDNGITITEAAVGGQNIVTIGEDMKAGDLVFRAGRRIKGSDVGVLTGVGLSTIEVHRIPRVGIMATGDEIVEPEDDLGPGQVRNVNQYLLSALAKRLGMIVNDYGVVGDHPDRLRETLSRAAADNDAVFVSGGSSKGTKDLTLSSIESLDDVEIVFHGVAIAPGKPTILARAHNTAIMGLPGNPAAAAVVFSLFGSALLGVLGGELLSQILLTRPRVRARLARSAHSNLGREDYLRARLEAADDGGLPWVHIVPGKSVAISTLAHADGLLRIPLQTEGLDEGAEADVILLF